MSNGRMTEVLPRDLFVLEDERNPRGSKASTIYPSTILDQVFDDLSPTRKTLREILADLKQEILYGGPTIVFPVESVNGKTGEVTIDPVDIGLGRVDNTRDIDKPLSVPQRTAIMDILSTYDFNVNLDELYQHLMDKDNPHAVTLEQINKDDALETFVQRCVSKHNLSTKSSVHPDIRRSLGTLWGVVDRINGDVEEKIRVVLETLDDHLHDEGAHLNLFSLKEDVSHKAFTFSEPDHVKYPTTKAVVEYVASQISAFNDTLPGVVDWIDDIQVVEDRSKLPTPSEDCDRQAYFIRHGISSHDEIAICRKMLDGTYRWDISQMGSYSRFNSAHFVDGVNGMSIKMSAIIDEIISEHGMLDTSLSEILSGYYKKEEIDEFAFVKSIKIITGTMDGHIRYYINDDMRTMSDDIKVAGLKRLAYLEYVTEEHIWDQAIHENHIYSRAVNRRHIQERAVNAQKMSCSYGHIFGNLSSPGDDTVEELTMEQLAVAIGPYLGVIVPGTPITPGDETTALTPEQVQEAWDSVVIE